MSFYKAKKKAEDLKQSGGNHITASGIYPVTILAPFVSVGSKGSTSVDFFINHSDKKQVIYGDLRITNNNDSSGNEVPNEIGTKIFNQLVIIAGIDDISEPVEVELPIGPKGAMKDAAILEDLTDIEVLMHVQIEYSKWNNNFQEKKVIKAFYRADKATAEEIVNDSKIGIGYGKSEKYFDNITYKEVTKEEIAEWISASRPKGTAGANTSAAAVGKKADFGKKRSFGKK